MQLILQLIEMAVKLQAGVLGYLRKFYVHSIA